MSAKVLNLKCKGCGAPLAIDDKYCKYCGGPVSISTFNSVYEMSIPLTKKYIESYRNDSNNSLQDVQANKAIAYCFLKLKMYDDALKYFEKAIIDDFNDSEIYFYCSICLLKGKKAFLSHRDVITKIEEYMSSAISIEPKGIYYYFLAYIKYDYFERKYLNTTPNFAVLLEKSKQVQTSNADIVQLFAILNVENPF